MTLRRRAAVGEQMDASLDPPRHCDAPPRRSRAPAPRRMPVVLRDNGGSDTVFAEYGRRLVETRQPRPRWSPGG